MEPFRDALLSQQPSLSESDDANYLACKENAVEWRDGRPVDVPPPPTLPF
jgi:hypothetical protein